MKMAESPPNGYKTLREKEKFLVTSNFSFSPSVFKRRVLQTRKNQGLFGKGLNSPLLERSDDLSSEAVLCKMGFNAGLHWSKLLANRWFCVCPRSVITAYYYFPHKPWFICVYSTSLLKTLWEKEKLLVTSNFSFSHSVFYPFLELSIIFIKFEFVVCKPFQFGSV